MDAAAPVCPSCGQAVGGTAPAAAAATTAPPKSGGALKVILLILGGIFLLGFLVIALAVGGAYYVAKRSHVEETSQGAKVETPFGTVETNNEDSAKLAQKMGIEVYPGARSLPGGASVNIGGMHSATVMFESDDPPEKIEEFYRKQFPKASVTATRGEDEKESLHTVMAFGDREKWTTITIEGHEGGSKFTLASVESGGK